MRRTRSPVRSFNPNWRIGGYLSTSRSTSTGSSYRTSTTSPEFTSSWIWGGERLHYLSHKARGASSCITPTLNPLSVRARISSIIDF